MPHSQLSNEEQEALRGQANRPEFMMPFSTPEALNLFVIHALRDMSSQQRDTALALRDVTKEVSGISDQLIRWETHVNEIADLKKICDELRMERQQRAGIVLFAGWLGKHFPWILTAAVLLSVKFGLVDSHH